MHVYDLGLLVYLALLLGLSSFYMWQFRIEIEYYSVAYFEHIAKFDAL